MRRSFLRRCLTVVAAAALGLTATAVAADSATAAPTAAATSIATLMKTYDAGTGRIGGGWWTGAVALSTVMTYRQASGDTQYDYAISEAFDKNKSNNFTNEYLDDTGWWALVWIQAYDITGSASYLQMARTDADYMHNYWDTTCGGGIYWSTARAYKASIANELFLAVTAGLHNRIAGDTTYLGWANSEWSWFNGSGLINSSRQVIDGINVNSCSKSTAVFTYNQGVVLAGLSELSRATGNTGLFNDARSIADSAASRLVRNGILTENCDPNCGSDGDAFKGIFMRGLRTLATASRITTYDAFIQTQAASIVAHDTNSSGQSGPLWAGPVQGATSITQASAAAALVSALGVTSPSTVGVLRGQESGRCVDVPNNTQTNSTRVALWDCHGGGNQTWTATASKQLTVYGTKCLDVRSSGTVDGTPVQIYDCNGSSAQQWNVNPDGTVVGVGSGKCLDATGHGTANGTLLAIWTCNGGANQKWARS
jgi:predicted alpha-1,6-mannanase (GH76 family)